jgi:hypothetical protein
LGQISNTGRSTPPPILLAIPPIPASLPACSNLLLSGPLHRWRTCPLPGCWSLRHPHSPQFTQVRALLKMSSQRGFLVSISPRWFSPVVLPPAACPFLCSPSYFLTLYLNFSFHSFSSLLEYTRMVRRRRPTTHPACVPEPTVASTRAEGVNVAKPGSSPGYPGIRLSQSPAPTLLLPTPQPPSSFSTPSLR